MSFKSDILLIGAAGAGLYLVIANADKIGAWLGGQFVKPAQEAVGEAIESIYKPIYDAGAATGTAIQQGTQAAGAEVAYTAGSISAGVTNFIRTIPGLECFGGSHAPGCPDAIGTEPRAEEYAKQPENWGIAAPAPTPTTEQVQAELMHNIAPITPVYVSMYGEPAPTVTQNNPYLTSAQANVIYSGSTPGDMSVEAAQRYARTFAMPGSEAWIAAGLP